MTPPTSAENYRQGRVAMAVVRLVHLVLLVTCGSSPTTGQEPSLIFTSPESYNASLGRDVVFTCVGVDGVMHVEWTVTGADQSTYNTELTAVANVGVLSIQATEENDGAKVVCEVTASGGATNESEPAVLRVQGFLNAPPNLMVTNMDTDVITLTWDPPPTIDLTDIHPDISNYTVYIELNSSHVWSETVTETEYTFTGLPGETEVNPYHVYQFSVSAWNVVGEGEQSDPVEGFFISSELQSVNIADVKFTQHNTTEVLVILKFQAGITSLCSDTITAAVTCSQHQHQQCTPQFHYSPSDIINAAVTGTVSGGQCIPNDEFCELSFSVQNIDGSSSTGKSEQFSTFDVQEVEVMAYSDRVMVTCYFATGSPAKGCYLLFSPSDRNMPCFLRIHWNDRSFLNMSATVKGLPAGTYSISVYDIEEDNSTSSAPAYQHDSTVTFNTVLSGDSELTCVTMVTEGEDEEDDMLALYITIPVATLVVAVVIALLGIVLVYKLTAKKGGSAPIPMKENSAYVTVVPQRGGATHQMEPCPAYGIARRQC